jgi:hypothetical protein
MASHELQAWCAEWLRESVSSTTEVGYFLAVFRRLAHADRMRQAVRMAVERGWRLAAIPVDQQLQ